MRDSLRLSGLLLLCALARAVTAQVQVTATRGGELEKNVQAIVEAHQGNVALFARDLKTGESMELSPDVPLRTASVIKLAILYEALKQVREGKAHWEDQITLNKSDQVPGSGVLLFFDTPTSLTLKDTLTMMIVMSDNTAANLAMDKVGIVNDPPNGDAGAQEHLSI